jgi:hypothetical protein
VTRVVNDFFIGDKITIGALLFWIIVVVCLKLWMDLWNIQNHPYRITTGRCVFGIEEKL